MRDDNTEPRDNQQLADDNQQSGTVRPRDADEQVSNRGVENDVDEDEEEFEDEGEEGPLA